MHVKATMILYSLLFFVMLQAVTVAGLFYVFRPKNRKLLFSVFLYILFLHSSYFFLFAPVSSSLMVRLTVEYLILNPYFIYMLFCMVLTPFFVATGLCLFLLRVFSFLWTAVGDSTVVEGALFDPGRRMFMKVLTSGIAVPLAGCSVYGAYVGKDSIEVTEQELFFKELPEKMDGFTITQISDIHAGPFMDGYRLQGFVQKMNALESDMIVITGDIINWGSTFIKEAIDVLSELQARKGVFAVLGNHVFYGNLKDLCGNLEKSGVHILRNRCEKIYCEDKRSCFYLAGIDDPRGSWYLNEDFPFVKDTLKDVPAGEFKVLLSHRPNVFDLASEQNVHLTLAGHTHGGQIILPSVAGHGLSLASIAYEYDYGLYQKENSFLYVNKGIGVVGPPIRLNCPREITRFVLRKKGLI